MALFLRILDLILKLFSNLISLRKDKEQKLPEETKDTLYDVEMQDPEFVKKVKEEQVKVEKIAREDLNIGWKASPNFTPDKGIPKTAIILHHTASFNSASDLQWMCDAEAKVSAHYLIGLGGKITQLVLDKDVAWHAGKSILDGETAVNNFGIGIELTGDTTKRPITQEQYDSLVRLVRMLMEEHEIGAYRVVDHRYIAPGRKVDLDPTNFDWNRFYEDIGA